MELRDIQVLMAMVILLGLYNYFLVSCVRITSRSVRGRVLPLIVMNILPVAYIIAYILK